MGKPERGVLYQANGIHGLMYALHMPPTRRRGVTLFPNSNAIGLNLIAYSIMPSGPMGSVPFSLWHRSFNRSHRRPPVKKRASAAIRRGTP